MNKTPSIALTPIKSSQIESVGHDPATNTMAVKFRTGATYHYHDVPAATFADMQKAESAGKFFGAKIKGAFKFTKLKD